MTNPSVRYERNSAGIAAILLGDAMGDVMSDAAQLGVTVFQSISPRKSNRYASSATVTRSIDTFPSPRQVAHLNVDVPYATDVERRHAVLARVADAIEKSPLG